MKEFLVRLAKKTLAQMGLEVRRISREEPFPRNSLLGVLHHVRQTGWQPRTCPDVGAAFGEFSLVCAQFFPHAKFVLIEPLEEYLPFLEAVERQLPAAKHLVAAATAQDGSVAIHVHRDLVGSSLLRETEGPQVDGTPRTVPARTLDNLCREQNLSGPYLVKLDVQGAELEVLQGAQEVLRETEYLILEVSFFRFFEGGPVFDEVIGFLKERGFVLYDLFGFKYRPLDRALAQVDAAFVKENGTFRKEHIYATAEQRRAQDELFQKAIAERYRRLQKRAAKVR